MHVCNSVFFHALCCTLRGLFSNLLSINPDTKYHTGDEDQNSIGSLTEFKPES